MKPISQRHVALRDAARFFSLALVLLIASPELCRAFSDPAFFAAPVHEGGGGGRFFTASYFDGYGCNVCHSGGTAPRVQVNGLPGSYQPGATYDIEVTWDQPASRVALHLEMVGRDGRVPGQVALPDLATVDARGRCGGRPEGEIVWFQRDIGTRKVLGTEICAGMQNLRFRFTPADVAELAFSASFVRSDGQADVLGDGVTTIRKVLRRVGEPKQTGDCALASGGESSRWPLLLLGLLALVAGRRLLR